MRDINTLHPYLQAKARELKEKAQAVLGLRIIITECLRNNDEQAALYAQGRRPLATVNTLRAAAKWCALTAAQNRHTVTNAATAADTWHGYGLAFDTAITDPAGKTIDWTSKSDWNHDELNDWQQVGEPGLSLDLEWGGNWTSRPDMPHFQFTFGKTIRMMHEDPTVVCGQTIKIPYELVDGKPVQLT